MEQEKGAQTPGETLFAAVKRGDLGAVEEALDTGVFVDTIDNKGKTPLMESAEFGPTSVAETLIERGADVNARDRNGEAPVIYAARAGDLEKLKFLISRGADISIRNNEDKTALDLAREMEEWAVVDHLESISAGAAAPENAGTSAEKNLGAIEKDGIIPELAIRHDDDDQTEGAAVPDDSAEYALDGEATEEPAGAGESFTDILGIMVNQNRKNTTQALTEDSSEPGLETDKAGVGTFMMQSAPMAMMKEATLAVTDNIMAPNEEETFTDSENKMVWGINDKIKKVLNTAGEGLGNYSVDTVFKGSHMAVLKPRSQEYKRFRKLWKHPDLLIDPRRWRDWTGAAAVKRYCLAEVIDVSALTGSHFIELYYVKDLKLILTLAEEANTNKYSLRQLKRAIEELRESKDDLDPGKIIIKTLDQPVPILDDPDLAELCADKDRVLDELSKAERKKIRSLIKARKPALDEWKNLMDTFEGILSDLEDDRG